MYSNSYNTYLTNGFFRMQVLEDICKQIPYLY